MFLCIKDQIQNMNLVIGCTVGCPYCYARNNVRRYHITEDFSKPEFFPNKLRLMEKEKPQNFLLTGMSDLAGWETEWREQVFAKIAENPQHQFLFLSKRPDLLDIDTDLENAWFGVTVTRKLELWRIDALRKNVRAKHYHVTFEPLFDDPGEVDFRGIDWVVIGTMTGAQSRKVRTVLVRHVNCPEFYMEFGTKFLSMKVFKNIVFRECGIFKFTQDRCRDYCFARF